LTANGSEEVLAEITEKTSALAPDGLKPSLAHHPDGGDAQSGD
jgi:hypothetical protein